MSKQKHMASKFLRHQKWWIKFRHPVNGTLIRESLETTDEARAELLRQRVDLEVALHEPRLQSVALPQPIRERLCLRDIAFSSNEPTPDGFRLEPFTALPTSAASSTVARTTVDEAVAVYLRFIKLENAAHHVANKVSMLRRFLGAARVAAAGGPARSSRGVRVGLQQKPFFTATFLDEISATVVQNFIEGLGVSRKTMRHYRECFHHLFEVCLKFDLYHPTNSHRPNPVAALPSYLTRNRHIVYLSQPQVLEQVAACVDSPRLQMAVELMIYAGLRRSEMLWLTRDCVDKDLRFLSVRYQIDEEADFEGSLKTGERTVTILPCLRAALELYLAGFDAHWLVPDVRGSRWNPDDFSKKLRRLNSEAGLPWNCLSFRHTYATKRAGEGWPLFRIAKEMGNSVAVVEEYYAAFIPPDR